MQSGRAYHQQILLYKLWQCLRALNQHAAHVHHCCIIELSLCLCIVLLIVLFFFLFLFLILFLFLFLFLLLFLFFPYLSHPYAGTHDPNTGDGI